MMNTNNEELKQSTPLEGKRLKIDKLSAGYEGRMVLKGVTLEIPAGGQLVITGENGAGKTTLLKTIIGTLSPANGTIILGDEALSLHTMRPSPLAYIRQLSHDSPFPTAAEEIVAIGLLGQKLSRKEKKERIELAMRRTGCDQLAGRNIYTLSGGERQRVSLARCIAQRAPLILLDEPTSFLDRESKVELRELLKAIVRTQGATLLLISHDHEWLAGLGWPVKTLEGGVLC